MSDEKPLDLKSDPKKKKIKEKDQILLSPDEKEIQTEEFVALTEGADFYKTPAGKVLRALTWKEHARTGVHHVLTTRTDKHGMSQFHVVKKSRHESSPDRYGKVLFDTSKVKVKSVNKQPEDVMETLDVRARLKRAQAARRNKAKMQRGRKLWARRMANTSHLTARSQRMARGIVRTRIAGNRGAQYQTLSPTEKMHIDKILDTKVKLIKKLALRLMPKVRRNEIERLSAVHSASAIKEDFDDFKRNDIVTLADGSKRVVRGKTGDGSKLLRLHQIVGKTGLELPAFYDHNKVKKTGETWNEETADDRVSDRPFKKNPEVYNRFKFLEPGKSSMVDRLATKKLRNTRNESVVDEAIWPFKKKTVTVDKFKFLEPGEKSTVDWLDPRKPVAKHLPFTGKNNPRAGRKEDYELRNIKNESVVNEVSSDLMKRYQSKAAKSVADKSAESIRQKWVLGNQSESDRLKKKTDVRVAAMKLVADRMAEKAKAK